MRVSYGYMSDMGDAEAVLSLVRDFFVEGGGPPVANVAASPTAATLQQGQAQVAPGKRLGGSPAAAQQFNARQQGQQQQPPPPLPLVTPPAVPQLPQASARQPVAPPVLPPPPPGKPLHPLTCSLPPATAAIIRSQVSAQAWAQHVQWTGATP